MFCLDSKDMQIWRAPMNQLKGASINVLDPDNHDASCMDESGISLSPFSQVLICDLDLLL